MLPPAAASAPLLAALPPSTPPLAPPTGLPPRREALPPVRWVVARGGEVCRTRTCLEGAAPAPAAALRPLEAELELAAAALLLVGGLAWRVWRERRALLRARVMGALGPRHLRAMV